MKDLNAFNRRFPSIVSQDRIDLQWVQDQLDKAGRMNALARAAHLDEVRRNAHAQEYLDRIPVVTTAQRLRYFARLAMAAVVAGAVIYAAGMLV